MRASDALTTINVTGLDARLVDALDRLARERGMSRAGLIRRCLYTCVHGMVREGKEPLLAPSVPNQWVHGIAINARVLTENGTHRLVTVDTDGLLEKS